MKNENVCRIKGAKKSSTQGEISRCRESTVYSLTSSNTVAMSQGITKNRVIWHNSILFVIFLSMLFILGYVCFFFLCFLFGQFSVFFWILSGLLFLLPALQCGRQSHFQNKYSNNKVLLGTVHLQRKTIFTIFRPLSPDSKIVCMKFENIFYGT